MAERGPGPEGGWPGPLRTHLAQPRGHSPASGWSKSPLTTLRTQGPLPPWEELRGRHASGRGRLVTQCSDTRDSLATPRRGYKDGRPFYLVAGLKGNKSQVHGVPDEAKSKADLRVEGSGGGAPPTRSASGHGGSSAAQREEAPTTPAPGKRGFTWMSAFNRTSRKDAACLPSPHAPGAAEPSTSGWRGRGARRDRAGREVTRLQETCQKPRGQDNGCPRFPRGTPPKCTGHRLVGSPGTQSLQPPSAKGQPRQTSAQGSSPCSHTQTGHLWPHMRTWKVDLPTLL